MPAARPSTYMCQKWNVRFPSGSSGIDLNRRAASCASKSSSSTPVASWENSAKFGPLPVDRRSERMRAARPDREGRAHRHALGLHQ